MDGRLAPGRVLQKNYRDPDDGLFSAYLVKTDRLSEALPSTKTGVIRDAPEFCTRETCLPMPLEKLVMFCAQQHAVLPQLRFLVGERVSFRIDDAEDGLAQWLRGMVKEVWPKLPQPCEFEGVQFADTVPYLLEADECCGRTERSFYCHRDDHTLIRREEHIPQTRTSGIVKRMEKRLLADGTRVIFDHATCRSKPVMSGSDSSDE